MKQPYQEHATVFECVGCRLVGIIAQPAAPAEIGVVIIVGGPQYRAGSHRQFTLLARHLAEQGIAAIRFDYRGMGDSEGEMRNFEEVDKDIHAAIDALMRQVPEVKQIALWGLCDAASAAMYYAYTDSRVQRLILLNPWVHTPATAAKARLKSYYLKRLLQPSFWKKLLSGNVKVTNTARDITATQSAAPADPRHGSAGYVERMLNDWSRFTGQTLFLLSGNDLTAQEFRTLRDTNKNWRTACRVPNIATATVADANHTLSSQAWRDQAAACSTTWLQSNLHTNENNGRSS